VLKDAGEISTTFGQLIIVAATAIGLELGLIDAAGSAALVGAGLLSVLIFPLLGLTLLRRAEPAGEPEPRREQAEPAPL
jgi:hypothetical protein